MVELADIEAAGRRLASPVRRTPLLDVGPLPGGGPGSRLTLKLENLQVTGSFKARGATNRVLTLSEDQVSRGLVTASGGNHGLGVAFAGRLAGAPVTIYLPSNVPPDKAAKLERWGARVLWEGDVWDDANEAALTAAKREGMTYVHPFADPAVIAGQGTLGLEILEDAPGTDLVLVAIGGGGLIAGVATAVKALRPAVRVVGIEPVGAPTLYESLKAGRVVELPRISTAANTLAPRRSHEMNLEIIQKTVDEVVLVTDEEMREAARWLWFEAGIAAELSGAASLAALLAGKVRLEDVRSACALICGAGTDGLVEETGAVRAGRVFE
ncbi:MAG TPA: threonine/serine dehydratase [Thermoanaerobaculia bacterium]|jgi:threonine dehydratase